MVAPYAGAWIETLLPATVDSFRHHAMVAPYAGAWIETQLLHLAVNSEGSIGRSPPTRGRGLKLPVPARLSIRTSNCRPLRGGVD